jgi:signal transduction histidine kinase
MGGHRLFAALPRKPVQRLQFLLLLLALVGAAILLSRVLTAPVDLSQRAVAAAALILLSVYWWHGYTRSRLTLALLPVEALAIGVVSAPVGGPLGLLGFMILSLGFRSVYDGGLRGLLPSVAYVLTLAVGSALAPHFAAAATGTYQLFQTAGLFIGPFMWLLADALRRQEDALTGQETLTRAGAQLVAAATREDIFAAGAAGVEALLDGRRARVVEPDDPAVVIHAVQLPLSGHGGVQAVLLIDGQQPRRVSELEPLEALCTLIALRLETNQQAQKRQDTAESRAERLAELNELKDELLDSVSHELRSPLTSIRAYSELLLTYQDAAVQREFLEIINSESERLARLVGDVLDLTHIQSGSFVWNMGPVDVGALLRDAGRIYRPLIAREGLEFDVGAEDGLPPVYGDRDRLLQVLGNLLHNALKFTIRGSVGLAAYHAGDEVHIAVSDSGVGVPADERERIFDKFHQAGRTPAGKAPGTGLGLAICRHIVEHHGGHIWVTPAPRGGSVFTIGLRTLPAGAALPEAAATEQTAAV